MNDITIVKFYKAISSMRRGKYKSYTSEIFNSDGDLITLTDVHLINDNGYIKIACMMNPMKFPTTEEERRWSEMMESLRKDIECFFGELKKMFAIIKYGSRFPNMDTMDDIFLTCVTVYNQKKIQTGLGAEEPWEITFASSADINLDLCQSMPAIFRRIRETEVIESRQGPDLNHRDGLGAGLDANGEPIYIVQNLDQELEEEKEEGRELGHDERRQLLVTHFNYALSKGLVYWPSQHGVTYAYNPEIRNRR